MHEHSKKQPDSVLGQIEVFSEYVEFLHTEQKRACAELSAGLSAVEKELRESREADADIIRERNAITHLQAQLSDELREIIRGKFYE